MKFSLTTFSSFPIRTPRAVATRGRPTHLGTKWLFRFGLLSCEWTKGPPFFFLTVFLSADQKANDRAVPGFAACLALKNQVRIKSKEFPAMVVIAAGGWTINHFAAQGFP
jgi:hypothetical protein